MGTPTVLRKCRFKAVAGGVVDFVVDNTIPELVYNFDTNSLLGFTGSSATLTATASGMTVVPTDKDPFLRSPAGLTINGSLQRYIVIDVERTAVRSLGAWQGQIYYKTATHDETENDTNQFPELTNVIGARAVFVVDMHTLINGADDWKTNTITQIRIDFEDGQSDNVTPNGQFKIHSITVGDEYFLPEQAGVVDQLHYNYEASNGDEWEIGDGLYTVATHTLTRTTIVSSSNGNQKVNFSAPPTVTVGQAMEFPLQLIPAQTGTLQVLTTTYATAGHINAKIPYDDTVPLNTEGTQILSQAITLQKSTNKVKCKVSLSLTVAGTTIPAAVGALFRGSTCIAAKGMFAPAGNYDLSFEFLDSPGATSATYTVRIGGDPLNGGTPDAINTVFYTNGNGTASPARVLGGVQLCTLTVEEVAFP